MPRVWYHFNLFARLNKFFGNISRARVNLVLEKCLEYREHEIQGLHSVKVNDNIYLAPFAISLLAPIWFTDSN